MRKFLLTLLILFGLGSSLAFAGQNTVTWTDNSSGDGQELNFKLERKQVANPSPLPTVSFDCTGLAGTYAQIGTTPTNVTSFVDTTVTTGNSYCYRVRASNAAGDSGYSNERGRYVPFVIPPLPTNEDVGP